MSDSRSYLSTDLQKTKNRKEVDHQRLFDRGVKISYSLYGLTILLFICWLIGHRREHLMVQNTSLFSQIFFFLNPHLFNKVFLEASGWQLLQGAVNFSSFIFLTSYIIALISFVSIVCLSIWLFCISFTTCIKPFHYISCLSVFPVIACFLTTWFILKLTFYLFDTRKNKRSRFEEDFVPEVFDDKNREIDPLLLAQRTVTTPFNIEDYEKYFKKDVKKDNLIHFYEKLNNYLS